jgi:ATP-dependent helicase STH1/SNF2
LTEEQWLEAIEDDEKDVNEVIAQKLERRRKKEEKKLQKEVAQTGGEEEPEPKKGRGRGKKNVREEDEDDVEPVTSKKGRGRGTKSSTSTEITKPAAKGKRGRKPEGTSSNQDTLNENERKALTKVFEQCYKAVEDCTVDEEEGPRHRCELFLHLPSKKEYPEYYQIIQRPIAMDIIKKRMRSSHYKTPSQFREDFHQMFQNARTFNLEGSWVYVDSERLEVMICCCFFRHGLLFFLLIPQLSNTHLG